jgi:ABC-2 type transport system permease protein
MMRLTKVELRRLLARRLTSIAVLGALVITGLLLFGAYQEAKPLGGALLASQRAMFDQERKAWDANGAQQVKDCVAQQAQAAKSDPRANLNCDQMEPRWARWGKPAATFRTMMPTVLLSGSYLLAFVGFLIGASFVAAEFSTGSMANWLTFEPRRTRVYASKLAAAGLGLIPVTVTVLGLLTAGVWLIVGHFGSTAGTTSKDWGDLAGMSIRSVVMTLAATVTGAAFGVLLRRTTAVLGIAIGYLVIVEAVFRQPLQGAHAWLLQANLAAWLKHGATFFLDRCTTDGQGNYNCQPVEKILTFGHAAAYLVLLVLFFVALGALVFRHRDVS